MKSLKSVVGLYDLVATCQEVQFSGTIISYLSGGELLRAVMSKADKRVCKVRAKANDVYDGSSDIDMDTSSTYRGSGYGLQLTWYVLAGTFNRVLVVRIFWHDTVYQAQVDFTQNQLVF